MTTLIKEATEIMEKMPRKSQQIVLDLLRMMNQNSIVSHYENDKAAPFKRTGKSFFNLPDDFDEHFDDTNGEIEAMFNGENV